MRSAAERHARLDALLDETLKVRTEQRAAFLAQRCAREPDLRKDAEELLRLATQTADWLEPGALAAELPWSELAHRLEPEPEPSSAGERVGPWHLLRLLGKGGMGTVYLAERADGEFEQTVALKLVRAGADSGAIMRRFELERQILARLQHPNIARLLDGGRTGDGQPYFAMEHVEGEPIDRYCDRRRLALEHRLALFEAVGRAVEHAHRNLVVHRDLKPSNIVVTGDGEVKLLDFGIAKVLAPVAGAAEPLTRTSARVLTPEYASPEQVLGQGVTTAIDVYQLGLLLYELLTGQRAHRLGDGSPQSMERAICEAPLIPPSVVVGSGPAEACAARRTTRAALASRLRGDLDNILMTALRKEPERRYASVGMLLEDLRRHREGLPVLARRDTLGYRVGKLVARYRALAALALVMLAVYAVTVTLQGREVARQRDRARAEAGKAEEVKAFLIDLFEVSDPVTSGSRDVTARELLDAGARRIETELTGQPRTQAEMLSVIGEVYRRLGLYAEAEPLLERAWSMRGEAFAAGDPGLAKSARLLARLLCYRGDYARAEALLREALDFERDTAGPDAASAVATLNDLAIVVTRSRSGYGEAVNLYREAVRISRLHTEADSLELSKVLNNLGNALDLAGEYAAAEATLRETLVIKRRELGENHPGIATALGNLGTTLMNARRLEEAETLLRQALAIDRRAFAGDHPKVADSLERLAVLLGRRESYGAAEHLYREVLAMNRRLLGAEHPAVARNLYNLANAVLMQDRLDEAAELLRQALAILEDRAPGERRIRSVVLVNLGAVLAEQGEATKGEPLIREGLAICRLLFPAGNPSIALAEVALGNDLRLQGRLREAEPLLLAGYASLAGSGKRGERRALEHLADLYRSLGRDGEAARYERWLTAASAPPDGPSPQAR